MKIFHKIANFFGFYYDNNRKKGDRWLTTWLVGDVLLFFIISGLLVITLALGFIYWLITV